MTASIQPLPGAGCRFFVRGRCLKKIEEDPAFHEDWRCRLVVSWEEAFDAYLSQVDRFGISQETALAIWVKRFEQLERGRDCQDFEPGDDVVLGCAHLHSDLCLLRTPPCPGRCRHYQQPD